MPIAWNNAIERQLLLTIVHLTGPKPDWEKVGAMMGEGFTAEATCQHFAKLKKEAIEQFGKLPDTATFSGKAAKGTPRKRKAGVENGDTPGSKGGRKRKGLMDGADVDDAEVQSPTKKVKKNRAGSEEVVKSEEDYS